jgi:hypothetical protein
MRKTEFDKQGVQHMTEANEEAMQQQEHMPSDITAFCVLIARIMMRCLKERDPQVMKLLSLSFRTETGENHDAA